MKQSKVALNTLRPGEECIVDRIEAATHSLNLRLLEMGLTKGTRLEVIRFAPMGDPMEIAVRGYRLSLRRVEAQSVIVIKHSLA